MKYLGVANTRNKNISRASYELVLFQSHYVKKTLDKSSKCDNGFVKTPMDISVYLSKKVIIIDRSEYSQKTISLIYIMNCTRLDIPYLVRKISRLTNDQSMNYWKTIKKGSQIFLARLKL